MPLPIIICDDSSFARKQMARALPKGWDVDVTFCANGLEAVEALRAGKGDILFLDLTMPELDGFGVLEEIRRHDLQTLPIVVSGDIQAESQRRVMQLGAVAFIKKPINADELTQVLDEYGVLGVLTENGHAIDIQVDFSDWCQEIANVAMGRTADLLTRVIRHEIELTVPRVRLQESCAVLKQLRDSAAATTNSSVWQGFTGYGLAGEIILQIESAQLEALAQLSGSEQNEQRSEAEMVMDIANVVIGAFLTGLAEQLDISFSQGQPHLRLYGDKFYTHSLHNDTARAQQLLTIELGYLLGKERIRCEQLMMFTADTLPVLRMRADYALGSS